VVSLSHFLPLPLSLHVKILILRGANSVDCSDHYLSRTDITYTLQLCACLAVLCRAATAKEASFLIGRLGKAYRAEIDAIMVGRLVALTTTSESHSQQSLKL
jgi:hypothetical protein